MGLKQSKGKSHVTQEYHQSGVGFDSKSMGSSTTSNSSVLSKKGGANGNNELDPNAQGDNKTATDIRSKYLNRLQMFPRGSVVHKPMSGGEAIRTSKIGMSDGSLPTYKPSVDDSEKKLERSPFDITEDLAEKLKEEGSQDKKEQEEEEIFLPPPRESLRASEEALHQDDESEIKVEQSYTDDASEGISLNFIQKKDANQIRQSYLKKLVYTKVWLLPEQKPKSHQTVIIFDWDDTLLCTSHLNPTGYLEDLMLPRPLTTQLRNLDKASAQILKLALENGKLFIITNAAPGWVEFSARKYLPEVFELLSKITIISARGAFQAKYPGNCHQWKMLAFLETQKDLDESAITNLLALGDSNIEIDAAHHLATKFQKALIKTVKFREQPSPEELVKQLHLVYQKFNQICHSVRNLTIRLERKSSRNGPAPGGPSIDGPAPPPGAVPSLG